MAKSFKELFDDACRGVQTTVNQGVAHVEHTTNQGFRNTQRTINQGVAHIEHTTDKGFRNTQKTVNQGVATVLDDNRRQHEATRKVISGKLGILWIAVVVIAVAAAIAAYLFVYNMKYTEAEKTADGGNGSTFVVARMVPDKTDANGNVSSYKEERKVDTAAIRLFAGSYAGPVALAVGLIAAVIAIIALSAVANRMPSSRRRR